MAVYNISTLIRAVMSSAAEAELGANLPSHALLVNELVFYLGYGLR